MARRRFGFKAERTLVREHLKANRNAASGRKMRLETTFLGFADGMVLYEVIQAGLLFRC